MPTILIYPGQLGEPVELQSVLREAHEEARKARQTEIDARNKARIPLDDSTRWPDVEEAISGLSLAHGARDSLRVAEHARRVLGLVEGNALEPWVAPWCCGSTACVLASQTAGIAYQADLRTLGDKAAQRP
jgi:hypothetical protein